MPSSSPIDIGDREICDALSPFSIIPNEDQIAKIREYMRLLLRWNKAVSLTSVTDPIEIVVRHFGESMFGTKFLPVENCRLADVGSGAGFPGIALKIICPAIQLILIESNKKKCSFLFEVARTLGLTNVNVLPERFEEIRPEDIQANAITSRAVGDFKRLLRWSVNALAPRGHLMLWVGAEDSTRLARTLGWTWQPAVRIPDSQRRFILVGRSVEGTSSP